MVVIRQRVPDFREDFYQSGSNSAGAPPTAVWDDRHERVLVVRQRRAPAAAPPFHQVQSVGPAGKKNVESDEEGVRVEAPTHSVRLLWDRRATEAVLEFSAPGAYEPRECRGGRGG